MWKNRVSYSLFLAAFIALVAVYEHRYTYLGLYAALGLPVLSLLAGLAAARSISLCHELGQETVEKGALCVYRVGVYRRRHLLAAFSPVFVHLRAAGGRGIALESRKQAVALEKPGEGHVDMLFTGVYRGRHSLGLERAYVLDALGLFRLRLKRPAPLEVVVLPRVLTLAQKTLYSAEGGALVFATGHKTDDPAVVCEARPYQPADSLRMVHWKLTARTGVLQSKKFQQVNNRALAFVLDNSALAAAPLQALRTEDDMLEAAVSLLAMCAGQGCVLSLYYPGCPVQLSQPGCPFGEMYPHLAQLAFAGNNFAAFAMGLALPEGMDVVLLLQAPDEQQALWAASLARQGRAVTVYAFAGGEEYAPLLAEAGVECMVFNEARRFAAALAEE